MKRFFVKLRAVRPKDLAHLILFALALPLSFFYKRKRKELILCCEYENEARDNGYWFFKYVRENHPERDIVYAINPKCEDYRRVCGLGECVKYGSLKHWVYYLTARVNISSQKGGKPNSAVCYLLEVYGILKNKRVFLQHGITKDMADVFFYENTKMRLFICGALPEYSFVRENFHYPEGYVAYTGFSRFDYLLSPYRQKKQILIAPTWRAWLRTASSDPYMKNSNPEILSSEYYKAWTEVLTDEKLAKMCEKYGYEVKFFPHRNVAHCFDKVKPLSNKIIIANWEEYDLQLLMKESALMITDYSSCVMDFAYMDKPVLYYQFDYDRYRSDHFTQGYFDYDRDGFGEVLRDKDSLMKKTEQLLNNPVTQEKYRERVKNFFPLRDNKNSERIYDEVIKLLNE